MIFDSHAHYDDKRFDADRYTLLDSLPGHGVCGVINAASDMKSAAAGIMLAEKYPYIRAAAGIHPHESAAAEEDFEHKLKTMLSHPRVVAVGEIGLDYHYEFSPRSRQLDLFERQLALACELDMPVIIHDREAHEDTLRLVSQYKPKGVVHCFSGSVEFARQLLMLGLYIGLGGAVTFKNAKKAAEVAVMLPDDRLLLETDAPYMAPEPFRGKRCDSSMIAYTAAYIAGIRGVTPEQLIKRTCANACTLFKITL